MAEDSEYVKSLKEQKKYYLDQLKKMRKALKKSNKPIILPDWKEPKTKKRGGGIVKGRGIGKALRGGGAVTRS